MTNEANKPADVGASAPEPVVDDPADNQSDYVVVDGVLTLRRDAEARLDQQGVTVVPAETEET